MSASSRPASAARSAPWWKSTELGLIAAIIVVLGLIYVIAPGRLGLFNFGWTRTSEVRDDPPFFLLQCLQPPDALSHDQPPRGPGDRRRGRHHRRRDRPLDRLGGGALRGGRRPIDGDLAPGDPQRQSRDHRPARRLGREPEPFGRLAGRSRSRGARADLRIAPRGLDRLWDLDRGIGARPRVVPDGGGRDLLGDRGGLLAPSEGR